MSGELSGKKIAILATDGFEQSELLEPKKALDAVGATTQVISPKDGEIRGWSERIDTTTRQGAGPVSRSRAVCRSG